MQRSPACLALCLILSFGAIGQNTSSFNLAQIAREHRFDTTEFRQAIAIRDSVPKTAVTLKGIVWLNDVTFKTGTIDVDLRGRNAFLNSFLGIAFHAKDKTTYDVVYFCPFRFDDGDTTRWFSVKYMSVPDYGFLKLRRDHPHVYEHEPVPAPKPADWFHATIRVRADSIAVFVNHASTPSLLVHTLPTLTEGRLGLWSYSKSLDSDFANLKIQSDH
jgi:hypothetical protein